MAERPEDLNLPVTVVQRIVKDALPDGVIVSKEARQTISRASSVFVLYLTSCAVTHATKAKRKTLAINDIFLAIKDMEFDSFTQPLKDALQGRKDQVTQNAKTKASSGKAAAASKEAASDEVAIDEEEDDDVEEVDAPEVEESGDKLEEAEEEAEEEEPGDEEMDADKETAKQASKKMKLSDDKQQQQPADDDVVEASDDDESASSSSASEQDE